MNSVHTSGNGIELRHLKLIWAIAEEGTLTAASGRLHLTQSALSHQLSQLEDELGLPLFRRLPRKMALTPAGESVLASARIVLTELERTRENLRRLVHSDVGTLRISTECYTCYHWLPARLRAFQSRYPRVDVQIVVEATRRPIEALMAGKLDIAIVVPVTQRRGLTVRPLFRDEQMVVMSPGHPWASKEWIRPADFSGEHVIGYSVPLREMNWYREILVPAGITLGNYASLQLTEAIIEMVKAGLGVAVLARWAVQPYLNPASLLARPLTRNGFHREWCAVTRNRKKQPPWVDYFIDALMEQGPTIPFASRPQ